MEISLKIQIFSVKEETSKVFLPYILIVVLSPLVVPTYILRTSRSTKSVRGELVWGFDDLNFNMSYYKNTRENRYEVKDIDDMFIFLKRIIYCLLFTYITSKWYYHNIWIKYLNSPEIQASFILKKSNYGSP